MMGVRHDSPEITEIIGDDYAVFLHEGPYEKLFDTYDRILNEWIANQEREGVDWLPLG